MRQTFLFLLLMLAVTSFSLHAKEEQRPTMQKLLSDHNIILTSWLSSDNKKSSAIYQPVILTIDIATPRWFTDGTVIETISIPNLIAQQRNLQATNYSVMKSEQTWSHQRWEIPLYPQQPGQYTVPSIGIKITVSVATEKNVQGVLFTSPHHFSAQRPTAKMTNPEEWVIASNATLTQTWDALRSERTVKNKSIKPSFTVGDAITRTTSLHASDSLAMLLPTVIPATHNKAIQRYTDPIQLKDNNNRGQHTAIREESETYILQDGGDITLPSIRIPFWNTTTQRSEVLILEGKTLHVKHTLMSWLKAYWPVMFYLLLISALTFLFINKLKHYYQFHPFPDWMLFIQSIQRGSWPEIRLYLYRRLFKKTGLLELEKYPMNNKEGSGTENEVVQTSAITKRHLWRIWFKIKK